MNPLPRWLRRVTLLVVLTCVGGLLFLSAMERGINHDEHQFVAPGVLISREGLLPYRDFPMFHLPNLAFIYAGLDRLTHQPVFSAKLLGVLASTGSAALIFLAATSRRRPSALLPRHLWLGIATILLLLCDQLFTFTAGKTWNHEFPAFLLLAAVMFHVRAIETGIHWWFALSGLCVGLAIGTRLTYLPVALAFPAFLFFIPLPSRIRNAGTAAWLAGCAIALLPTIYFLCMDRERFVFDNLQFPRLRLVDPLDTRVQKTITWWRKIRYFFKEIVAHSVPLVLAFLVPLVNVRRQTIEHWWRAARSAEYEPRPTERRAILSIWSRIREWAPENLGLALTLAVLPLAVVGCFLPSRYQYQHHFVFAPLLTLAIGYRIRTWPAGEVWRPAALAVITLFALSPWNGNPEKRPAGAGAYLSAFAMTDPQNWFSTTLRKEYDFVERVPGNILTLAPIGVLEAGGRIYAEFSTGPFAWRAASLLPVEKRKRFGLLAPEDLPEFLGAHPPAGIITGVEDEPLEKPFIDYATSRAFVATPITRRRTLWLPKP